jgi:guanylate kinase
MLITISGPSGAGKTTLSNNLKQLIGAKELPSYTTREPRSTDINNTYYHFISNEEFENLRKKKSFILIDKFSENLYGTLKDDIVHAIQSTSQIWIADLTCLSVKDLINIGYIPNLALFLYIPRPESKQRMKLRGDSNNDIEVRLQAYSDIIESSVNLATQLPGLKFVNSNRSEQSVIDDVLKLIKGN